MEFLLDPLGQTTPNEKTNWLCPENAYQCGCNTVAGCACPKT